MTTHKRLLLSAILPIILLVGLLITFLKFGPLGVFKNSVTPIENAFIQKVIFSPEHITVDVINDGPEPVTIAQVLVNDVYWQFEMTPATTLAPLRSGRIEIDYPWNPADAEKITLLSRNGVTFEKEIEAAVLTPTFNKEYFKAFVLLGIYVGVIPVLLGLLWLPFLRILRGRWYNFLLAMTVGLLMFLGVDALSEAFELLGGLPKSFNGIGILLLGFSLAVLTLSAISYKTQHLIEGKEDHTRALLWGYLIALGIGIHNLGEGLAIGSAYSIGEVALGSSLVIGFMIHNVTEGIAIVAPLTRTIRNIRNDISHLVFMGLLAGIPTILGALIGGFAYAVWLNVLFLAIGAGAIFDVSFDIAKSMRRDQSWLSLFRITHVVGFFAGLLIMYLTGLLVAG